MKKFWLITKIQLGNTFDVRKLFHMREKKHGMSLAAFLLAGLATILLFGGISAFYSYSIGMALQMFGILDLLPVMMMAVTCMISLFTTVYKVKGTLFSFNDYDALMSLPIPTSTIVASRVFVLYLFNLFFSAIVLIPADIVYGVLAGKEAAFYILAFVMLLFLPMVPIIVATLLGIVVAVLSSRFRHQSVVTLVVYIVLVSCVMILPMKFSSAGSTQAMMTVSGDEVLGTLNKIYPLTKFYHAALIFDSISAIAGYIGSSVLLFAAYCILVGNGFKKLNTAIGTSKVKSNYHMKKLSTKSVTAALYEKELRRYFSSPNYVMNTAVGVILATIASLVLIVAGKEQLAEVFDQIPQIQDNLQQFVPMILNFCVALSCTTAPSISLEGKNLWILKSSPVDPLQIFLSKIYVNLTVTVPLTILNGIILSIGLKLNFVQMLITIVYALSSTCFIACFGLYMGLKFPRFDWNNEMAVVKQGVPMTVTMLVGMALAVLPIGIVAMQLAIDLFVFYLAFAVISIIITIGILKYLETRGTQVFMKL